MNKQDEEKARELAVLCNNCLEGIPPHPSAGCVECEQRGVYYGAIEMAAWKEQQMIEKAVSILRDEIQYHDIYEERDIETFRKRMMEEN